MTRLIIVGFPEPDAATLRRELQEAGLRPAGQAVKEGLCGQLMVEDFEEGGDPLSRLTGYDAIVQPDVCRSARGDREALNYWPQLDLDLLERIRRRHEDVTLVLNRAEPARLIENWGSLRRRLVRSEIPGLPAGAGGSDDDLAAWIQGHYDACAERFGAGEGLVQVDLSSERERRALVELAAAGGARSSAPADEPAPERLKAPVGGWKVSSNWTQQDAFALEAMRPLGEAFLPWTGYALSPSAILKILTLAELHRPRVVVELGAGLSTVFLARYLRYRGLSQSRLISADDDTAWLGLIRGYLEREDLADRAELVAAPRRPWALPRDLADATDGDASWTYEPPDRWYAADAIRGALGADEIDLLIVDGPKGKGTITRYPALVEFADRLSRSALVVLDDAQRAPEQEVVRRWELLSDVKFDYEKGSPLAIGRRPR